MSEYSSERVESRTNMLGLYATLVSVIGVVVIIVGAFILIWTLVQEFSGEWTDVQASEVGGSVMVFVWGLALMATGSAMAALRTIAVNCARMVEKE